MVGRDGVGDVVACIPEVVETVGGGESVGVHGAAEFGCGHGLLALGVKVGIAEMAALAAVLGGEFQTDNLPVVWDEIDAHGSPVFPQHFRRHLVPAQVAVSHESGGTALRVDGVAVAVEQHHAEEGLAGGTVVGVLQYGGIVEHDERVVVGIDVEEVFDGLVVLGEPVAQADGPGLAWRHQAQVVVANAVGRQGVPIERMVREGRVFRFAAIEPEGTVAFAPDIAGSEVVEGGDAMVAGGEGGEVGAVPAPGRVGGGRVVEGDVVASVGGKASQGYGVGGEGGVGAKESHDGRRGAAEEDEGCLVGGDIGRSHLNNGGSLA